MRQVQQPIVTDIKMTDDIFVKAITVPDGGSILPQHSHKYDHITLLAHGSMRIYAGDEYLGDYTAPAGIMIRSGVKHRMITLTDGVVFCCIHALHGTDDIEIEEEHQLEMGE